VFTFHLIIFSFTYDFLPFGSFSTIPWTTSMLNIFVDSNLQISKKIPKLNEECTTLYNWRGMVVWGGILEKQLHALLQRCFHLYVFIFSLMVGEKGVYCIE
jgi:hypothetical protein